MTSKKLIKFSDIPEANIPPILYKYSGVNEHTTKVFQRRQIYFSSPNDFNDPMDCFVALAYDKLTQQDITEYNIDKFILEGMTSEQALAQWNLIKNMVRPPDSMAAVIGPQMAALQANVKVFCLTGSPKNLLMWAHYGKCHSGICIGYDTKQLIQDTGTKLGKVKYSYVFPTIKPNLLNLDSSVFHQVMTKAKPWSYEKEYRLFYRGTERLLNIQPDAFKELIFGSNSFVGSNKEKTMEVLEVIKNDAAFNHVELKLMKKPDFSYHFKLDPFDRNI